MHLQPKICSFVALSRYLIISHLLWSDDLVIINLSRSSRQLANLKLYSTKNEINEGKKKKKKQNREQTIT